MLSQTTPDEQSNPHLISEVFDQISRAEALVKHGLSESTVVGPSPRIAPRLDVMLPADRNPEIPATETIGDSQRLDAIVSSFES